MPASEIRKLTSISGSGSGYTASARRAEPKLVKSKPGGKTARQALSESRGTGVDLRTAKNSSSTLSPPPPTTFLRPSGVDAPTAPSLSTDAGNDTKPGKRSREGAEAGHKRQKKKKAASSDT